MKHRVDERLLDEVERFRLRYSCEACVHFEVAGGRCGEGFPNQEHRQRPLQLGAGLYFCKAFELA